MIKREIAKVNSEQSNIIISREMCIRDRFNIEFQAISEGDTVLEVTTRELYDLNEAYIGETPSASKTVSICLLYTSRCV